MLPALLLWLFWIQGLALCPSHPQLQFSYFTLPTIAGMTSAHHHAQLFSYEMESHKLFSLDLPLSMILPISISQVARITGMSYQCSATFLLNTYHPKECITLFFPHLSKILRQGHNTEWSIFLYIVAI
jgi:hypothetical protein